MYERLGSGGSLATVWRCTVDGFTCAMKELGEAPTEIKNSFLNEINLIENLSHENIVRYLGHCIRLVMTFYASSTLLSSPHLLPHTTSSFPLTITPLDVTPSDNIRLFMEYYPMSLADLIKKRKLVAFSEAKHIALEVAKGLEYLHRQVKNLCSSTLSFVDMYVPVHTLVRLSLSSVNR